VVGAGSVALVADAAPSLGGLDAAAAPAPPGEAGSTLLAGSRTVSNGLPAPTEGASLVSAPVAEPMLSSAAAPTASAVPAAIAAPTSIATP
jgi:hypothetical protein